MPNLRAARKCVRLGNALVARIAKARIAQQVQVLGVLLVKQVINPGQQLHMAGEFVAHVQRQRAKACRGLQIAPTTLPSLRL